MPDQVTRPGKRRTVAENTQNMAKIQKQQKNMVYELIIGLKYSFTLLLSFPG